MLFFRGLCGLVFFFFNRNLYLYIYIYIYIYIVGVGAGFGSLAQKVNGLRPKELNTMNL